MRTHIELLSNNELVASCTYQEQDGTTKTIMLKIEERLTTTSSTAYKRVSRLLDELWAEVDQKDIVKPIISMIHSDTEVGLQTFQTVLYGVKTNRIFIASRTLACWDDDTIKAVIAHELGHIAETAAGKGKFASTLENKPVKIFRGIMSLSAASILPLTLVGLNSLLVIGATAAAAFAKVGLKYLAKALHRRYEIACDTYSAKYVPKPALIPKYLVQSSTAQEVFNNPQIEPRARYKLPLYFEQLNNSHPNVFKRTLNLVKQTTKAKQAIDLEELRLALTLEDEPWLSFRYPAHSKLWQQQVDAVITKAEKIQKRAGIQPKSKTKILDVF